MPQPTNPFRPGLTPRDDDDQKVLHDVATHGCHIVGVMADELGPAFAYSIGLFHNFGHPEILIFGLSHPVMQDVINVACDAIKEGKQFAPGSSYIEFLHNAEVEFRPVDISRFDDHLGYAQWFYGRTRFPVLQLYWPDKQGRFPWQADAYEHLRVLQPEMQTAFSRSHESTVVTEPEASA